MSHMYSINWLYLSGNHFDSWLAHFLHSKYRVETALYFFCKILINNEKLYENRTESQ